MNCKPGDLAIIVNASDYGRIHIGKIVQCIRLERPTFGRPGLGWLTEPGLAASDDGKCLLWCDEHLRPIRDPGDDAVDEVLQRIGSPNEATV